jgi:hypothetical protein
MLSDSQKEQIRLEEMYRSEIRQSLAFPPKGNTAWSFLNSPLGLWLLSTVLIGLVTWSYQRYQTSSEAARTKGRRLSALVTEAGYRLHPIENMQDFHDILVCVADLQATKVSTSALPEFKDRSFTSLLWEMEALTGENKLLKSLQDVKTAPIATADTADNLNRFNVFCYYWSRHSTRRSTGGLSPPAGIVIEDGHDERPLTNQDLNRQLK